MQLLDMSNCSVYLKIEFNWIPSNFETFYLLTNHIYDKLSIMANLPIPVIKGDIKQAYR